MDNNLPKDPPSPFGSSFNPHTNPIDPNNPYSSQPPQNPASVSPNTLNSPNIPNSSEHPSIHSEVAQHRPRDARGHFLPYEHPVNPNPSPSPTPTTQTAPTIPNPPTSSMPSKSSNDEPLFEAKINNPFSKFFNWIKKLIKNEGINIKIKPLTAIGIAIALTGGGGIIGGVIVYFFPNSSPVLHRAVVYQGKLTKNESGFTLTLPNSDLYTLKPKSNSSIDFKSLSSGSVLVKGNLTPEKFVLEASEIVPLGTSSDSSPNSPTPLTSPNSPNIPNPPNPSNSSLPSLYPSLTWELTQSRTLIFTSGKRKIEQEGVYLESAQIADFPQEFMNYYTNELTNSSFKQTFNSSDPNGTTITYAKDDLFLTYGVKNVYQGSGDTKKLVGYKAFIEHN